MRYCYHDKLYHAHGVLCDPVYRPDGKCVLSPQSQLVEFEDGCRCIVIRRNTRLKDKCKIHSNHEGVHNAN